MNNITLTGVPVIAKWVVKFDETYDMPQFIQGTLIGGVDSGKLINIKGIESLDLDKNVAKTDNGLSYKLIGPGKTMVLVSNSQIQKMSKDWYLKG